MKPHALLPASLRRGAAVILAFMALSAGAEAASSLDLKMSADRTTASVTNQTVITYTLFYSQSSTSEDADNAVVRVQLPPEMTLKSATKSVHVNTQTHNSATNMVTFNFKTPLEGGSSGQLIVQTTFKTSTANGTIAGATATFTADDTNPVTVGPVNVTATVTAPQTYIFKPGPFIEKSGNAVISSSDSYGKFTIKHGNPGEEGDDLVNYIVEDILPPGLKLTSVATGKFANTSQPITAAFCTNLDSSWRPWQGTAAGKLNTSTSTTLSATSNKLVAGEYVTGFRLYYGNLPGGAVFHPDTTGNTVITVQVLLVDPAATLDNALMRNCAYAHANGKTSASSCYASTVDKTYLSVNNTLGRGDTGAPSRLPIGYEFSVISNLTANAANTYPLQGLSYSLLLPPAFEYAGGATADNTAYVAAGSPEPSIIESIPNFKGTGKTLVRLRWDNHGIKAEGKSQIWRVIFPLRVTEEATEATHSVEAFTGWDSPKNWTEDTVALTWQQDSLDYDGDGRMLEYLSYRKLNVVVGEEVGSGVASVESASWVKGELDTTWSRYPDVGNTVPGGQADFQLRVKNTGQVDLKNLVIIDILPGLNDTGVIDPSPRGSEWEPFLAGPVSAPDGVKVYYSSARKPQRNELTPGLPSDAVNPKWNLTPPADITTVRSLKFDFGTTRLRRDQEIILQWPMRAPLNAPVSGEIAWNSFGFIAKRMDNSVSLLPSEPRKTGFSIQAGDPPFYGDYVWYDSNRNGIQDPNEQGADGVRVMLFRDNGDDIPDPNTDEYLTFTLTFNGGGYLFSGPTIFNILPAKYYAVVELPDGWLPSPAAPAGTSPLVDSNGTWAEYGSKAVAVMPMTEFKKDTIDRSWDLGLIDMTGLPSVWAMARDDSGRYVIGGSFSSSGGVPRKNIARINTDGSLDRSFDPMRGQMLGKGAGEDSFNGSVSGVAVLGNGSIVVAGDFTEYNGVKCNGLAVLKPDGSPDIESIAKPFINIAQPPSAGMIDSLCAGPDGSVFIAGSFPALNVGTSAKFIARIKSDQNVDTAFAPKVDGPMYAVASYPDGRVLIAGDFSSVGGTARHGVARLNADGTLDKTFDSGSGPDGGSISAVTLQSNDNIVIAGTFTNFSGAPAKGSIFLRPNGKLNAQASPVQLNVNAIRDSD